MGVMFFLFSIFLGIKILVEFDPEIAKLVEFTLEFFFKIKIFSISLSKNGEILPGQKTTGWAPQELGK